MQGQGVAEDDHHLRVQRRKKNQYIHTFVSHPSIHPSTHRQMVFLSKRGEREREGKKLERVRSEENHLSMLSSRLAYRRFRMLASMCREVCDLEFLLWSPCFSRSREDIPSFRRDVKAASIRSEYNPASSWASSCMGNISLSKRKESQQ